jgi:Tol biopolymer transport system component/DNA-binding winged helix-turn-helix (wHTH) protein
MLRPQGVRLPVISGCDMPEESEVLGSVRFGRFELSADTGELRKDGIRLKLSGQAIMVLTILAANPGKLVTREELQQKLWPGASFGDPEHGLNAAVNKLRETLGDSATEPKYIETVPGRGYRFIAALDSQVTEPEPPQPEPQPPEPPWRKRKVAIALAASIAIVGSLYPFVGPQIERWWRLLELQRLTVAPLTTLPGNVASPSFSPDGSQLAFAWDGESNGKGYDLYVKAIGSDRPLRLTSHPATSLSVAWSPDGQNIAMSRSAGEDDSGVYLIASTGGPERKIASRNSVSWFGKEISWSADGKYLAYIDHPSNTASDVTLHLYLLSLDTLEKKRVSENCNSASTPAFSPHGTYLAWVCNEDVAHMSSLRVLRLKVGKETKLPNPAYGIAGIAWSRDESQIVFSSFSHFGALWEVSLTRPTYAERLPVGHDATDLATNPGGRGLAYVQGSTNVNIWRLDLQATPPQARKLVTSSREQASPSISPDGSKIVFESTRSGAKEIWICDADGANAQQLTHFGNFTTGTARWSPDGNFIVFDSRVEGEANLYLIDPRGGVPRKLQIDVRSNSMPSWSHDGAWIYFVHDDDALNPTVWKVSSSGGHAVQIAGRDSNYALESADGKYVYFARNNRLWQVRTDGSNEELVAGMPEIDVLGDRWYPVEGGIYFLARGADGRALEFFDFKSKRVRPIFTLERPTPGWMGAMPVSRDGKWLLYPQLDSMSSDIMMIENWR